MTRAEQLGLLITVAAAVVGGVSLSTSANAGPVQASGAFKVNNASLRRGLADAYRPGADDGDWQAPQWSVLASAGDVLRSNHPLYRRPAQPGEAMYTVQCGSWGQWYYDPPSESYF
jgi:hypothetical protein